MAAASRRSWTRWIVGLVLVGIGGFVLYQARASRIVARHKITMEDMSRLADALDHYAEKSQGKYPGGPEARGVRSDPGAFEAAVAPRVWPVGSFSIATILPALRPYRYLTLSAKDAWGSPFAYAISGDDRHYVLVSLGCDGKIDGGRHAWRTEMEECGHDVVLADGKFLSYPKYIGTGDPGREVHREVPR